VFRDEDGESLFDTQLDIFDSDEDVGGVLFDMEMMVEMN
jgi:hypothetical protein